MDFQFRLKVSYPLQADFRLLLHLQRHNFLNAANDIDVGLKIFGVILFLCSASSNLALAQNLSQQGSQTTTSQREALSKYGCSVDSAGISTCSQDWAIRNANEVMALRAAQLNNLNKRITDAKGNHDQEDNLLQGFRAERQCDSNDTFQTCTDRVRRHLSSQTLEIRQGILNNNKNIYELSDGQEGRIQAQNPDSTLTNINIPPTPRAKRAFDLIREQQLQKQNGSSPRPCSENPFRPCSVVFGSTPSMRQVQDSKNPDEASALLLGNGLRLSKSASTLIPGQDPNNPDASIDTPLSNGAEDANLRKQVNASLSNKSSAFSRKNYQSDIEYSQAVQKQLEIEEKNNTQSPGYISNPTGPSWDAFHSLMDELANDHPGKNGQLGKTPPPTDTRNYTLQITPGDPSHPGLTPEQILQNTGMIPSAAPQSPSTNH